jgi:predicted double-glycine peptidase
MTPTERANFITDVASAVKASAPMLSDEEHRWIKLAIERQKQSIDLRNAIITKSLVGLTLSFIGFMGYVFLEWAKAHGFK